MDFDLLKVLQKSNKKPKEGQIFVLEPKENLFCFGRVIKTNVESRDSFVNGMYLIFIYDYFSDTEEMPEDLLRKDILIVEVINAQLWRKGFAKNIAEIPVTKEEINADYGFWDILREYYVNLKGDYIEVIPKYKGTYGLGSYGSIGRQLNRIIVERGIDCIEK
jgi:hypothetical protein